MSDGAAPVRPVGRPTIRTAENRRALEDAFSMGGTVADACMHADISQRSFYEWQADDEEFSQRIELLRRRPVLKALKLVDDALAEDVKVAQWYLERRHSDFKPKQGIDHSGSVGGITHIDSDYVEP